MLSSHKNTVSWHLIFLAYHVPHSMPQMQSYSASQHPVYAEVLTLLGLAELTPHFLLGSIQPHGNKLQEMYDHHICNLSEW